MAIILGAPPELIYLALGLSAFFFLVVSHILLVRLRVLRFQLPPILMLAFLGLGVYGCCAFLVSQAGSSWNRVIADPLWGAPLPWASAVFYFLLALFYTAQCAIIEGSSPSLRIMEFVGNAPGQKASFEQIEKDFLAGEFVLSRLEDLAASGFILPQGGRYVLAPKGKRVARFFAFYRRSLGRGLGG